MIVAGTADRPNQVNISTKDADEKLTRILLEAAQVFFVPAIQEIASNPNLRGYIEAAAHRLGPNFSLYSFEQILKALSAKQKGLLLWSLNKGLSDPGARKAIADIVASDHRDRFGIPGIPTTQEGQRFKVDGLITLANLVSKGEAAEMLAYFGGCTDRRREETVLHHRIEDVVSAPHVLRIATDERVLAMAAQFLEVAPIIIDISAWWSLAEGVEPIGAQVFHRDRDDFRACKLFVYLNDVDDGAGPHIFVRGSHRLEMVMERVVSKGMPPEVAHKHFEAGDCREVAGSISDIYGDAVTEITGPPGTSFLENTYGFHRGKVPLSGSRCILQVLYGCIPYPRQLKRMSSAKLLPHAIGSADTKLARHAAWFLLE